MGQTRWTHSNRTRRIRRSELWMLWVDRPRSATSQTGWPNARNRPRAAPGPSVAAFHAARQRCSPFLEPLLLERLVSLDECQIELVAEIKTLPASGPKKIQDFISRHAARPVDEALACSRTGRTCPRGPGWSAETNRRRRPGHGRVSKYNRRAGFDAASRARR